MKSIALFVIAVFVFAGCSSSTTPSNSNNNNNNSTDSTGWHKTGYNPGAGSTPSQIFSVGNTLYSAAVGFFRSTDKGDTWVSAGNGINLQYGTLGVFAIGSNLYFGTPVGVYFSSNSGDTWKVITKGFDPNSTGLVYMAAEGNYIFGVGAFVGSNQSPIYRLVNGGDSLMPTGNNGIPKSAYDLPIFTAGTSIYAYEPNSSTWYRSQNDGSSWSALGTSLANGVDCSVSGSAGYLVGESQNTGVSTPGIFASADGATWTKFSSRFDGHKVKSIAVSGTHIFATMSDSSKIFYSSDNGSSWTDITAGIASPNLPGSTLAIFAGDLYAGAGDNSFNGSIWKRPLTDFK